MMVMIMVDKWVKRMGLWLL